MKVFKTEKARTRVLATYDRLLSGWGVELQERDIETKYGSTHIIVCGSEENPPLVLFHGVGDNSALMWVYNAKELSGYFRIYAVDTIGGPGKSRPNENYNKTFDQIEWVDEIFKGLQLDKAYMAGVSNGAYITQHYGIMRPERVIKMVCLSGSIASSGTASPIKTMLKVFLPEAFIPTKRNVVKLIQKLSGKHCSAFTDNAILMEHFTCLLRGFNNMSMTYHRVISFNNSQLSNITDKCLFLCGADDPLGEPHIVKENLDKYNVAYRIYEGVGHGINHEIPDEINKRIEEYFGVIPAAVKELQK